MLERFRPAGGALIGPLADLLVRRGVHPDVVTWVGTGLTVAAALVCFPQGWLWQGALLVGAFACLDMLDGQVARRSGRASEWGAFLDSTLDRVADGAVLAAIAWYFAQSPSSLVWAAITLWALIAGEVTSYVKARAEALGRTADGGLATRSDRLAIVVVGALLAGLGFGPALSFAVVLLALASTVTVIQRMAKVRAQCQPDRERVHG